MKRIDSIMKKILAISLFCLAALTAGAQTMYEAINYAETNYYGTARSAALGNAMTAVGSDLGSIGINPAGAAVAGYSQFTITPGLSISSTSSTYAPSTYGTVTGTTPDSQNRFIIPNVDTRRDFGLKNWTFGMTINTTNVYNERMSAGGVNHDTSMMGEMAYFTNGIPGSEIAQRSAYDNFPSIDWPLLLAFQSGLTALDEEDDMYIGSTEKRFDDGTIGLSGPIHQDFFRQRTGSKSDALINLAFNWNDNFYFGGNIGVTSLTFNENINKVETPVDKSQFGLTLDAASAIRWRPRGPVSMPSSARSGCPSRVCASAPPSRPRPGTRSGKGGCGMRAAISKASSPKISIPRSVIIPTS